MEAVWVAAEMRAGGAYARSILAIEEMEKLPLKDEPGDGMIRIKRIYEPAASEDRSPALLVDRI